ncbi:hypothetical protein D9M71_687020 [compost metagenome]
MQPALAALQGELRLKQTLLRLAVAIEHASLGIQQPDRRPVAVQQQIAPGHLQFQRLQAVGHLRRP